MLSIAVAALAMATNAKQTTNNFIMPLYDMVTDVSSSGILTANLSTSATWNNSVNSFNRFKVYKVNGDVSHFSPDGTWNDITSSCFIGAYQNTVTIQYATNQNARGTLWVQYMGTSSEGSNGAESSCIATQFGMPTQVGHGSLPGAIVPIIRPGSEQQDHQIPITFYIDAPYAGSWDGPGPRFWMNTGNNNSPYVGNGWQIMNMPSVQPVLGSTRVTATGNPNSNAGYYCIGVQETYVPSESYNYHNSPWTEFSAVIRPIPAS